ncbi:low-specificity L-threonine aldolase [bacterium]|nr:low-specificity L-threonine aldolase [bacterium]
MIDLRSDTVTKPTPRMREVMMAAEVGDDVYGEDPTVNKLEAIAAEKTGMEASIFVSSGTQSNLLALMSHCQRGDEYIVGQGAHTYRYEGGGAAVLGSIQPQPLDFEEDGTLALEKVKGAIKPDDFHFAKTRLFCLENTQSGKILPLQYLSDAAKLARKHNLGFHLDGARVFNAAVGLKIDIGEISGFFDSVSVCLSKGLGAPIGSVLCGKKELIDTARRWRKVLGGGMRQAGILAAAGLYALENHVERLEEDHANADYLALGLSQIEEVSVASGCAQTNMVFFSVSDNHILPLTAFLENRRILIYPGSSIRLVTHLDISKEDITSVIDSIKAYFKSV